MSENESRMTAADHPPSDSEVADWMGKEAYQYWMQTVAFIERVYPNVFSPEWLYGGKKHGWCLRYKKSKSFCSLVPEKNRFSLLLVFGAEERMKVEDIRGSLSPYTAMEYDKATTYHDGKWLLLTVDSGDVLTDVFSLFAIKRKPKIKKT